MIKNYSLSNLAKIYLSILSWIRIRHSLKKIKLLAIDVDGVLTNGNIYLNSEGEIYKSFNVKDGLGLKLLREEGIKVAFISGGDGGATEMRAKHLGIDFCEVRIKNKSKTIENIQRKLNIDKTETAFVGDDLNDIPVRYVVDLFFAPRDASKHLFKFCDAILINNGGSGAIRELSEKILKARSVLNSLSLSGWLDCNN